MAVKKFLSSHRSFGEIKGRFVSNHYSPSGISAREGEFFIQWVPLSPGGWYGDGEPCGSHLCQYIPWTGLKLNMFIRISHLQPRLWGRYIDDVLLVWDHGEAEHTKFVEHLNSVHTTFKFTDEHSLKQASFLSRKINEGVMNNGIIKLFWTVTYWIRLNNVSLSDEP